MWGYVTERVDMVEGGLRVPQRVTMRRMFPLWPKLSLTPVASSSTGDRVVRHAGWKPPLSAYLSSPSSESVCQ